MLVIVLILEITKKINEYKSLGNSIGFVPTMGALHDGHLSLVKASKKENDITVVSIFVNPEQFNDNRDLINYPRSQESDINKLKAILTEYDIVFIPNEKEIYPVKDERTFNFGNMDRVMEGKYRQNHFNGVARIVSKLFDIITPHKAYFGEKDFQQLVIIKHLTRSLELPVKIISVPIIREENGLAMSSRNQLLSDEQRKTASLIYKTLSEAKTLSYDRSIKEIKKWVMNKINSFPQMNFEYFEIVDTNDLQPVKSWDIKKRKIGCIAVRLGKVRLIDNIFFDR